MTAALRQPNAFQAILSIKLSVKKLQLTLPGVNLDGSGLNDINSTLHALGVKILFRNPLFSELSANYPLVLDTFSHSAAIQVRYMLLYDLID